MNAYSILSYILFITSGALLTIFGLKSDFLLCVPKASADTLHLYYLMFYFLTSAISTTSSSLSNIILCNKYQIMQRKN